MFVTFAFGAFNWKLTILCHVDGRGKTAETQAVLSNKVFSLINWFGTKGTALAKGMRLLVDNTQIWVRSIRMISR
jgi:hypothetical protein